jgi:hypothetical protein
MFIEVTIRVSPSLMYDDLQLAVKALEYQWSEENMGAGKEHWTPKHAQDMANVIDRVASMATMFWQLKDKEREERHKYGIIHKEGRFNGSC